jgi:hypothetical protein
LTKIILAIRVEKKGGERYSENRKGVRFGIRVDNTRRLTLEWRK